MPSLRELRPTPPFSDTERGVYSLAYRYVHAPTTTKAIFTIGDMAYEALSPEQLEELEQERVRRQSAREGTIVNPAPNTILGESRERFDVYVALQRATLPQATLYQKSSRGKVA